MRILIKVILTLVLLVMAAGITSAVGHPAFTFVFAAGILAIWAYNPKKKSSNTTDLDKTI